jgi:site-specific DNA recombinase
MYTQVRGKTGDQFAYYVCNRRHREHGCGLPYLPALELEDRLTRNWPIWVRLDHLDAQLIAQRLADTLTDTGQGRHHLVQQAERRLARLDKERRKLVQMAYAEAIPLDLLKIEQDRIAREQEQARRQLTDLEQTTTEVEQTYERAQAAMRRSAEIYALAGPEIRRQLNQAFLAVIEVDVDEEEVILGEPWDAISRAADHLHEDSAARQADGPWAETLNPTGRRSTTNSRPLQQVWRSRMNPLVELTGFEPVTP